MTWRGLEWVSTNSMVFCVFVFFGNVQIHMQKVLNNNAKEWLMELCFIHSLSPSLTQIYVLNIFFSKTKRCWRIFIEGMRCNFLCFSERWKNDNTYSVKVHGVCRLGQMTSITSRWQTTIIPNKTGVKWVVIVHFFYSFADDIQPLSLLG